MHLHNMRLRKSVAAFAATVVLALALGAQPARSAEPVQLTITADHRYTMEVPRGLCHIDPDKHPADKKYFEHFAESFKPENLLLAAFGDCPSVERMRKRFDENSEQEDLERWAQVMAPMLGRGATPRQVPSGMARTEILDLLAKFAGNDRSVDVSLAVRQLNAAPAGQDPDPKNIGTLAHDKIAVFTGTMFRTSDAGKTRLIGGIQAMTAVGQYAIAVNDFRTFAGRDSLDAGVADTREIVRGLIARNEK